MTDTIEQAELTRIALLRRLTFALIEAAIARPPRRSLRSWLLGSPSHDCHRPAPGTFVMSAVAGTRLKNPNAVWH